MDVGSHIADSQWMPIVCVLGLIAYFIGYSLFSGGRA